MFVLINALYFYSSILIYAFIHKCSNDIIRLQHSSCIFNMVSGNKNFVVLLYYHDFSLLVSVCTYHVTLTSIFSNTASRIRIKIFKLFSISLLKSKTCFLCL